MPAIAAIFDTANEATPGHHGPSETALLLMDFHHFFVHKAGVEGAPAALEVAVKIRKWAKSQGIQVIHCLNDVSSTPFSTCKHSKMYSRVLATMKIEGGEEPAELVDDQGDDLTFMRSAGYVSALESPGVEEYLRGKGIKSLILAGISTAGCVLTTTLAACDAGYVVTVISDGCADHDDAVHDLIVGKLVESRGYATTADQFQKGFEEAMANGNYAC